MPRGFNKMARCLALICLVCLFFPQFVVFQVNATSRGSLRALRGHKEMLGTEIEPPTQSAGAPIGSSSTSVMPDSTSSMSAAPPVAKLAPALENSVSMSAGPSTSSETSMEAASLSESSASSLEDSSTSLSASEESGVINAASLTKDDQALLPVRVVDSLSGPAKSFVRGSEDEGSENSEYSQDESDPELIKLKANLKQVQDAMVQDRRWVEVVRNVIAHYRSKIINVESNLKQAAMDAFRIKGLIANRHKDLARQRLQAQLDKVVDALKQLQNQNQDVSSKKQELEAMKRELQANIVGIQRQISGLHDEPALNQSS